jgi:hypothetical protein
VTVSNSVEQELFELRSTITVLGRLSYTSWLLEVLWWKLRPSSTINNTWVNIPNSGLAAIIGARGTWGLGAETHGPHGIWSYISVLFSLVQSHRGVSDKSYSRYTSIKPQMLMKLC